MQVLACAAAGGAGDAHRVARAHQRISLDEDFREMAVADRVVAVLQNYIFPGRPVLTDLYHHTLHHGQSLFAPGPQVDAVVESPFPRKGVCTVAVWRRDLYLL